MLAHAQEDVRLKLNGSGWLQFGRVMHSSDTLDRTYNYNDNWFQSSGAQFTVLADIDQNWEGAMGLGGFQVHNGQGTEFSALTTSLGFSPFITEARITYFLDDKESSPLELTFGLFPYHYNRDVKNLGQYLFRGPVYPGFLISEFESSSIDTTVANMLGMQARHRIGNFTHDLILRSETELPPVFDFSLGYLAQIDFGGILELGMGVNFHRLMPIKGDLTNLRDRDIFPVRNPNAGAGPYDGSYAHVSTDTSIIPAAQRATPDDSLQVIRDTTFLSHQGAKLMGRMAFHPGRLLESDLIGPNDFKLYTEIGVIGVRNYKGVYPDIKQRIPVLFGFNIPTFRLLDEAALEVEWYGAPYRNDYYRLVNETSPVPVSNSGLGREADAFGRLDGDSTVVFGDPFDVENMRKDNWKWSLYLAKTFQNHVRFSMQVANDHFRPNTLATDAKSAQFNTATTTLKDWNLMFRLGFLF